jgi:predicted TIM-barrel fold metal-dependent hydrolase
MADPQAKLDIAGSIDTDVHADIPSVEALRPYLSAHWRDYLGESNFRHPVAVTHSYPTTSPIVARGSGASLDDVREHVLARSACAIVNCYYGVEGIRNPFMSAALATAVNSWFQAEWLDREPRLLGSLVVPPHDTQLAVEEIDRFGSDPRYVQVFMPARAWEPYGHRHFWPIYEAAVAHDLAIAVHFGGVSGMPTTPVGWLDTYFEECAASPQLFAAHVLSLVSEGVFDTFPTLRVVLLESGVTWLPTWLWRLDMEWKAGRREIPWVKELPSRYVRRHIRLSSQPLDGPDDAAALLESIQHLGGPEMILYSSDYPHCHRAGIDPLLAVLSAADREAVLRDNALSFYQLQDRVLPADPPS